MARSYKKNAIRGYASCSSEKADKRIWHKRLRAVTLRKLTKLRKSNNCAEAENEIMPIVKEVSDPWLMDKDGKHIYFTRMSLREEINGYIAGLKNSSDKELYFKSKSHVLKDFCKYFRVNKPNNKIFVITDKQKEKFIAYFAKRNTSK